MSPFENNGEFFCLDLQDPNTLILGPKSVLEPYSQKYKNLVFVEDLTPAQKAKLEVPNRLGGPVKKEGASLDKDDKKSDKAN